MNNAMITHPWGNRYIVNQVMVCRKKEIQNVISTCVALENGRLLCL